ncbi:MAG: hypothetical protein H6680_07330 [Desulfobacteraceae bacterium]|nr:hypothetical protein [Desulfobacteraceae bacterium]
MKKNRTILLSAGIISFILSIFQAAIGFSPSLSLYFGAPEALADNIFLLIAVSLFIAVFLAVFGFYALSGAGYIRLLPWLRQMLFFISALFIIRGLMIIPEILVVTKVMQSSVSVAPRFIVFSTGSLVIGLIFLFGTLGFQKKFSSARSGD